MNPAEELTALVPMRHHSERVLGKNYRPLAGRPLYAHILDTLEAVREIAAIVVDTDSLLILEALAKEYPQVQTIERPAHLRAGEVPMNAVLEHDVRSTNGAFYLQTHSTNPLLRAATISRAIRTFFDHYPDYDSLFSVTRWQTRLWNEAAQPINHDPAVLLRTQDLPPVYEENSCLYLFERERFLASGNRLGARPQLFEIDPLEALDIDEEHDFLLAEVLMKDPGLRVARDDEDEHNG